MELISAVIALAVVLAVLVILLLILAFYWAGWRYRSQKERRKSRHIKYTVGKPPPESCSLIEADNSKTKCPPIKQCHTKASQTEPGISSLQQLRRSLNLENFFPHSSADVVLRRKSLGAANGRPSSQPVDRRLTRSRLSGTSTLTENKRVTDSEFDVLAERTPSSASLELDSTGTASSCGDHSQPHTHCDPESADNNSLYISESTLDSIESGKRLATAVRADKFINPRLHVKPLNYTDGNANARKYKYCLDNGEV